MKYPPSECSRTLFVRSLAIAATMPAALPALASGTDTDLQALIKRFDDPAPKQQSAGLTGFARSDRLRFPEWMEGEWEVHSRLLNTNAPLGRRLLPADLARMRLGDMSTAGTPLDYTVRFTRRRGDNAIVSDRAANLRAVQNAAAGFERVEQVTFDGLNSLNVVYSPFGPNGTYTGPSRAEIYINWRRQADVGSRDVSDGGKFAFAEATRTVLLSSQRELSRISDAETLCCFERRSASEVAARQRVLRYLTPNPNSAEGVLWSEARGRAVAMLDYELFLTRVRDAPPLGV